MKKIVLLVLFIPVVMIFATPNPSSVERDVLAILEKMHAAGLRRDVAAMQPLYSPDYFHTNADGSIMTLAQVYDSYRAPTPYKFDDNHTDEQRVIVHGDLAVVNERVSLHGTKEGAGAFTSRYRVTYVLERRGKNWLVLNSHASLLGIEPEK